MAFDFTTKLLYRVKREQYFPNAKLAPEFAKSRAISSSQRLEKIIPKLKGKNRDLAFWILAQNLDKRSLHVLVRLSKHHNSRIRSSATWALGMIKDSEVKKLLAESFRNDRSAGVIWESAKGLISQEARQFISMFLETAKNSGHIDRRRAAVYILGNLSVRKSVPILVSLLLNKSEDEGLRGEAAEALGNIMDHRAIDPLIQTLDDDSVEVRFWSIFALGQLDAKKALPRLRKIARIDKATLRGWWSIKKEAIDAINNIMRKPITSRIR